MASQNGVRGVLLSVSTLVIRYWKTQSTLITGKVRYRERWTVLPIRQAVQPIIVPLLHAMSRKKSIAPYRF